MCCPGGLVYTFGGKMKFARKNAKKIVLGFVQTT
jgi:hypothetical protein